MADRVIYFPYIRVPQSRWFIRTLLYWDEVGAIIPSDYIYHPTLLDPYTRELVQTGLVTQVLPQDHIDKVPKFKEAFCDLIDRDKRIARRRDSLVTSQETFPIHIEKLDVLTDELCQRNLARRADYPWFEVEKVTADLFMAYLASVLGNAQEFKMTPITDRKKSLMVFPRSSTTSRDQLRMSFLEGVLPAPLESVPVVQIADFKNSNRKLLSQFRIAIERYLIEIADIRNVGLGEEKTRLVKAQLMNEMDEIVALMREKRWPNINFGTLFGLFAAGAGMAEALIQPDFRPIATAAAISGLLGAVYSAFGGTRTQVQIARSPLAYAALAQRQFAPRNALPHH